MKKMLMMMTLMMSLIFVSCNTNTEKQVVDGFNPTKGYFKFTQFNGNDSVYFDNTTKIQSESKLEFMVFDACLETKSYCNNPLTFKPKSVLMYSLNDTNIVSVKGETSNSYGVPGGIKCVVKFIDNKLIENSSFAF